MLSFIIQIVVPISEYNFLQPMISLNLNLNLNLEITSFLWIIQLTVITTCMSTQCQKWNST